MVVPTMDTLPRVPDTHGDTVNEKIFSDLYIRTSWVDANVALDQIKKVCIPKYFCCHGHPYLSDKYQRFPNCYGIFTISFSSNCIVYLRANTYNFTNQSLFYYFLFFSKKYPADNSLSQYERFVVVFLVIFSFSVLPSQYVRLNEQYKMSL